MVLPLGVILTQLLLLYMCLICLGISLGTQKEYSLEGLAPWR
jgi:hypothetical protein